MKSNEMKVDIDKFKIGTSQSWKFGIITREVFRINENKFEINDTSNGWVSCTINKETLTKLVNGEICMLDLNWK